MPPLLALALCIAFVLFLLRLERKQAPDVTRALWIPTIWILIIASKPLGVWFQQARATPDAGSPIDRAVLIVLLLAAMSILLTRDFDWAGALNEQPWLMALIVFMLVSILWSDIPTVSFKRWIREFQAVLMAFVVMSEPSPRRALESILRRVTYILIPFSPLLIKYFREYGVDYGRWSGEEMWIGVTLQKNSLVSLCMISIVFLIWSFIRRRQGHKAPVWKYQTLTEIFILGLAFWLMGGPRHEIFYSATSVYALGAGILVYGGFYIAKRLRKNISPSVLKSAMIFVAVVGIFSLFTGGSRLSFFASTAGREATLTGRTEVWASLLPTVMKSPVIGGGFGGFWTPRTQELYRITGAHSGYLDVLLGLGFAGMILVLFFYLASCGKAYRELARDFDWGVLGISYIIMSVVHNVGESSIDSFTNYLTAIVLFFAAASSSRARSERVAEEAEGS